MCYCLPNDWDLMADWNMFLTFIWQLLVVLGSVGLSEFTEIKMKKRDERVRKVCSLKY